MIRVLVVDDSPTARRLIVDMFAGVPGIQVTGEASNGDEAVRMTAALRPDVIVMDLVMPALDGFQATDRIMMQVPTPIVIVSSHPDASEVAASMRALEVGALTILPKPPGPAAPDFEEGRIRFVSAVRAMAGVKVVRRWPGPVAAARPVPPPAARLSAVDPQVIAVAASTGGPSALLQLLRALPAGFSLPILVVQHISAGFVDGMARWLSGATGRAIAVAQDGEVCRAGGVYLAPDAAHLLLEPGLSLRLSMEPPVGGFRPSANALFASVARTLGPAAIAVVLTGMGEDGLDGAADVRRAGGLVLAQDAETSVVFGMPGAVAQAGLAHAVLPLDAIAPQLAGLEARHR